VIHTYRDPADSRSRVGVAPLVFALFLLSAPILALFRGSVSWAEVVPASMLSAIALLWFFASRRTEQLGCREIRLSDDGSCELETKQRVIRLHASQIRCVEYQRDSETGREHYTIRFGPDKVGVAGSMPDFLDFVTRLKTLNPAVDMSSFPALVSAAWPDAAPAVERSVVDRFLRSALFPLLVIVLFVYVSSKTFIK
jgi:hypothetical protein